jgi:hypothetical protein
LDDLLEIGLGNDDFFGENPLHLSPFDMTKSRDRSPQPTSQVPACDYGAVQYVKPPFEGWTVPPFPAPRNREEKKWLRGFLKGRLPSQRKTAKMLNRRK